MNEDKANMILGNIQQLTETLVVGTNAWIAEREDAVKVATEARDKALYAVLGPLLDDIRCGRGTADTADAILAIVKEVAK